MNMIYFLGAIVVFFGTLTYGTLTARYHDDAGEIVGLSFIAAAIWPLIAVALLVAGLVYATLGPFWLLTKLALRRRARA